MFQKTVYQNLSKGIPGEYADDSPRRDTGFVLLANVTEGTAASGTLVFTANPADGDTITIGSVVYRFETNLSQANDVKIGDALTNTLDSLEKTINGEGVEGTDYFAGTTTPLTNVVATASGGNTLTLKAVDNGYTSNLIALASSSTNVTVTPFAGGADETSLLPQFGYAFTQSSEGDDYVQVGGTGEFKGVLVNPKMYANFLNLNPAMTLPNGSQGSVCDFGHVLVISQSAFTVGNIAAFDTKTGAISAYLNESVVPANAQIIPNSKFIQYSGEAGSVGVLQLGN